MSSRLCLACIVFRCGSGFQLQVPVIVFFMLSCSTIGFPCFQVSFCAGRCAIAVFVESQNLFGGLAFLGLELGAGRHITFQLHYVQMRMEFCVHSVIV